MIQIKNSISELITHLEQGFKSPKALIRTDSFVGRVSVCGEVTVCLPRRPRGLASDAAGGWAEKACRPGSQGPTDRADAAQEEQLQTGVGRGSHKTMWGDSERQSPLQKPGGGREFPPRVHGRTDEPVALS